MKDDPRPKSTTDNEDYEAPSIRHLGNLADLTQKTVGAADGSQFLGLDIGSI